jgi:hypothetical protein
VTSAGKHQDKTDRNIGTCQEKTNRNIGIAHSSYPYSSEDNQTRLGLVWLQIRRSGFALSVWQWIPPVHANEGETDGNRI